MDDKLISIAAIIGILLGAGLILGLLDRRNFRFGWLLAAGGLIFTNDALLTNLYGILPRVAPGLDWNWQGKTLALLATLAIAAHPAFGWKRSGLTLAQAPGSMRTALPVAILYGLFFLALALVFPNQEASAETIAFQLTMPSFEEEPFYRGILLLALYEAFCGRVRWLGIDWSWGALIACIAFGLAHAFSYSDGSVAFDPIYFALTAVPSLLAIWVRMRTGSLLLPVLMHSFGNTIMVLV
ncbi:CPBP family intramembrane glutamic endopeptidase, BDIM_20840 family [Aurantiacibacter sediminis]|uniref:CPBP family intramembrane metalloprotease n=1 Tax=Aurantiacibacter sediminis TaxID=2793064 RepID=A0ABS0N0Y6_9SPHN|nr:CPBP family intramembrane glutamic endopeptidase [Aurantiacibacter sediminis]MBH5321622.1 CPBP family intramembrane metalloprotease [Aurantiacibacter sediminis]